MQCVKPHLDNAAGIPQWHVDTAGSDKILAVETGGITEAQVIATVQKAGFKIGPLNALTDTFGVFTYKKCTLIAVQKLSLRVLE